MCQFKTLLHMDCFALLAKTDVLFEANCQKAG